MSIPSASNGAGAVETRAEQAGRSHGIDRWLTRKLLAALGSPPLEIALWDGERICLAGRATGRMNVRDRGALWRLVSDPDLNFGDDYSAGLIEVEGDLVPFLELIHRALRDAPNRGFYGRHVVGRRHRARANSLSGSRDNIHHHYDISNDFYRLWLDEEMVYTCAYFRTPDTTLEAAQLAKMDHVCRKLRLAPGETVVEAGCGWGSLARHMARYYGVKVKAYNISREQVAYARERARAEGLDDRIEYIEDDYRNIDGTFDAFVSVGMLEHVGPENYAGLGRVIDRCLGEDGRGLIHSVGRNQPAAMNSWLERRVFPGAQPPSLQQMMNIFEPWDLSVVDVENLRLHYAKTLGEWLHRFDEHVDEVRAMYDERFVRAWRLYLAGTMTSFSTGVLQLFQVVFARGASNEVPWTRDHIYTP